MKDLKKVDLKDVRVLLRVDLNVPVHNGRIMDLSRIKRIIPIINYLKKKSAKIILVTHFGQPKTKESKHSIRFLEKILAKYYKIKVRFTTALDPQEAINLKGGELLLLENIRFHQGEEANDYNFAKTLASLGEIYVNDAFSCSHRKHASIVAITEFLPSYPGLSLLLELKNLHKAVNPNLKPKVIVIAGLKVSSKFKVLTKLIDTTDHLIIGGAMANTFLHSLGYNLGRSYVEKNFIEEAKHFYNQHKSKIVLPKDLNCEVGEHKIETFNIDQVPTNANALDVGTESVKQFLYFIKNAKLIMWNGPLGYYENPIFAKGTIGFAKGISKQNKKLNLHSIIGGGDTIAALSPILKDCNFSYVSTSGGAFLEWLEDNNLPGLVALGESKLVFANNPT